MKAIEAHVQSVNVKSPIESRIKTFKVLPKEFSVKDGEVSPTMRVNRAVCASTFATLLAGL